MGAPQSGTTPGGIAPPSSSTATGSGHYTAQEDGDDSDVELDDEEMEEVARIDRECAELERRLRGLNSGQQRALLENLANSSNAVMGGLLADTIRRTAQIRDRGPRRNAGNVKVRATQTTANNDPKYIEDLASGTTHVLAFQRHRSRLRAVQFQVAQGTVVLQPRTTPAPTGRALPR